MGNRDLVKVAAGADPLADGVQRDVGGLVLGEAIDAGGDAGEGDAAQAVPGRQLQTALVAARQLVPVLVPHHPIPALQVGSDRVDDI